MPYSPRLPVARFDSNENWPEVFLDPSVDQHAFLMVWTVLPARLLNGVLTFARVVPELIPRVLLLGVNFAALLEGSRFLLRFSERGRGARVLTVARGNWPGSTVMLLAHSFYPCDCSSCADEQAIT